MSAESQLIALLRGSPALADATTGVFLNAADEATPLPYVVVTATHDAELLISGVTDIDHVTFTLASWGASAAMAEGVANLVQAVLEADDDYAVLSRTGGFDEQTANDCAVVTADRWL